MSEYPSCKHGQNDPNSFCLLCDYDARLSNAMHLIAELKNALADANDYDCAAIGENASLFAHRHAEFDSLCTRAGKFLTGKL